MNTRQKGQAKASQDYTRTWKDRLNTEWRHQRYNNKGSKCIETQSKTKRTVSRDNITEKPWCAKDTTRKQIENFETKRQTHFITIILKHTTTFKKSFHLVPVARSNVDRPANII